MYEMIITKAVSKVFSFGFTSHKFKKHKHKTLVTTKRKQTSKQTKSNKKQREVVT